MLNLCMCQCVHYCVNVCVNVFVNTDIVDVFVCELFVCFVPVNMCVNVGN